MIQHEFQYTLLGNYISNPDLFDDCKHLIRPQIWTEGTLRDAYKVIASWHQRALPIDGAILYKQLTTIGYASKQSAECVSKLNTFYIEPRLVNQYIETLFKDYATEFLKNELGSVILNIGEKDVIETLAKVKDIITTIEMVWNNVSKDRSILDVFDEAYAEILEFKEGKVVPITFTWGIKDLDQKTGGVNDGPNVVAATPGSGKCLGYGTKVLMFDGSLKEVQYIKVGELIMGVDSTPRTVLSTTVGREMMYEIRQNQGINYTCNESHILSLKASYKKKGLKVGDVVNISVKDFIETIPPSQKIKYKGYKTDIEWESKPLPLDPYFLGIWLGDGTAGKPQVTTPDKEIADYIHKFAESINQKVTINGSSESDGCLMYSIVKHSKKVKRNTYCLYLHLKELGLIKNKHIPKNYLINSKENRLQLLAGLLDTDGYLAGNRYYEIIQKDHELAKQIKFLADSLGFKVSITERKASIKSTGFTGLYYRINISGNIETIPLKVQRKKAYATRKNKDWRVTAIDIKQIGEGNYYGFTLDKDGLFLLEDFTVTHNTSLIIGMAVENCLQKGYPFLLFSLEMKAKDLMKNIIANITEINSRSIREGNIDDQQLSDIRNVRQKLTDLFQIDETDGITWQQVETKIRAFRKKHKIPLSQKIMVAIDFIQKMRNSPDEMKSLSKEERVETIANELARVAKHENVSLIEISQFSREASKRDNPRPKITDLKGSAAIEQNAVLAILMYRPDQHGIMVNKENGMDLRGLCELNIAKGRFVNPEPVYARFEGKYSKFRDFNPNDGIATGDQKVDF